MGTILKCSFSSRTRLWFLATLCIVTLCLHDSAIATLVITLQPDASNNVVVSLSTADTTTTSAVSNSLTTGGGGLFTELVPGNAFGTTWECCSASSLPANQALVLETPLTVNFGGTNYEFGSIEFDQDVSSDADFAFGFDGLLPEAAVSYTVVDTGFSLLRDPNNEVGNGPNALVPFTDFVAGTYTEVTEAESTYLGGNGTVANPGMRLIISNDVLPEPSSFLLLACGCIGLTGIWPWRRWRRAG